MGAKYLSGVSSAVFGITTVAGAGAQTIEVGFGPHSSITTLVSGTTFADTGSLSKLFAGEASDFSKGADLGSTSSTFSVDSSPATLTIWVTETGINLGPTPQKLSFLSDFTQNRLPVGASVTETTYFDASDTAYGIGTKLATDTFTSSGTNGPGVTTVVDALKPYSLTEEYVITIPLATRPTSLSTISLDTTTDGPITVPEPSTWTMMALGFAGLGYAAYGRRRKFRAQASIV